MLSQHLAGCHAPADVPHSGTQAALMGWSGIFKINKVERDPGRMTRREISGDRGRYNQNTLYDFSKNNF